MSRAVNTPCSCWPNRHMQIARHKISPPSRDCRQSPLALKSASMMLYAGVFYGIARYWHRPRSCLRNHMTFFATSVLRVVAILHCGGWDPTTRRTADLDRGCLDDLRLRSNKPCLNLNPLSGSGHEVRMGELHVPIFVRNCSRNLGSPRHGIKHWARVL